VTRYFRQYFHSDPMLELDESTAQRRGSYVAEVEGAIRVFRCFANHKLESLVYPGWDDPATPLADARRRVSGAPSRPWVGISPPGEQESLMVTCGDALVP